MGGELGWLLLGIVASIVVYKERGISLGIALLGGLFLGPLMFLFLLQKPHKGMQKCGFCASWIPAEAVVCQKCGRDIAPGLSAATNPATPTDDRRFMPGARR